jgi:hypothetical protein
VNLLLLGFPVLNFASREAMVEEARSAWWGEASEQPKRAQQGVSRVRGRREQRRLNAEPMGGKVGILSGRTLHNGLKSYIRKRGTLWANGSARVLAPIRWMDPHPLRASLRRLGRSGVSPHHPERQTDTHGL